MALVRLSTDDYADGISITSGSPREHVWTFAIGLSIDYNYPLYNACVLNTPNPSHPHLSAVTVIVKQPFTKWFYPTNDG